MTEALFIGGPFDGQHRSVPEGITAQLTYPLGEVGDDATVKTVTYRLESLAGEHQRFPIMVGEGLTADQVIARLLENYRPDA